MNLSIVFKCVLNASSGIKRFPVIEFSMRKSAEQKESIFIRLELNGAVCKHVDNTQDATIDVSVLFLHICGNGHIERKSTP